MGILGQFQFRRDLSTNWSSVNPVLLDGELGIESDTNKFKLGNGSTSWSGLSYGGIKGDVGPQGIQGSTGPQGPQGNDGWSPILAVVIDGERRVLQVVDWVGGMGAKPATGKYIASSGFVDTAAEGTDVRGPAGTNAINTNSFANVVVGTTPLPTTLVAGSAVDSLTINAGTGITYTADAATDTFTIANSDTGSSAVSTHVGQTDPHTQYYNQTRGDARYAQVSHTQTASTITDFTEAAQDSVGSAFTAGTSDGASVTYGDAGNTFNVANTDKGSTAVATHVSQADPHPQYLTQAEGDALYQPIGGGGAQVVKAFLTATQANTTVTPAILTGHTFTIPPGKSLQLNGVLVFTGAATTTGAFYGMRGTQGTGANGNLVGAWHSYVNISSAAAATGLATGNAFSLAGGASTPDASSGVLGTATTAGNNAAAIVVTAYNTSTNVNSTIELIFRSEVAASAVTAQIGTGAVGVIG